MRNPQEATSFTGAQKDVPGEYGGQTPNSRRRLGPRATKWLAGGLLALAATGCVPKNVKGIVKAGGAGGSIMAGAAILACLQNEQKDEACLGGRYIPRSPAYFGMFLGIDKSYSSDGCPSQIASKSQLIIKKKEEVGSGEHRRIRWKQVGERDKFYLNPSDSVFVKGCPPGRKMRYEVDGPDGTAIPGAVLYINNKQGGSFTFDRIKCSVSSNLNPVVDCKKVIKTTADQLREAPSHNFAPDVLAQFADVARTVFEPQRPKFIKPLRVQNSSQVADVLAGVKLASPSSYPGSGSIFPRHGLI